jgi:hypothetical protein
MNKKSRLVLILIEVIVVLILISGFVLSQNMRQIVSDIIFKGISFFKVSQEPIRIISLKPPVNKKTTTTIVVATTTIASTSVTTIPNPELKPTTCYPVPSGPQTYDISTDNVSTKDNPEITQIFINPLDIQKFARQIVSVNIQDINGKSIIEVSGTVATDNNSVTFPFFLISGTSIGGTWQGSWQNQDSYCQNYKLSIIAKSESGQSDVVLTFK